MTASVRPGHGNQIEFLGTARFQHGPLGDRVYLIDAGEEKVGELLQGLIELALRKGYSKIFAKLAARHSAQAEEAGFLREAYVPGYFQGREDAVFYSRFFSSARAHDPAEAGHGETLLLAEQRRGGAVMPAEPEGFIFRAAEPQDAETLAALYGEVFDSYPFPIDDPGFIRRGMESGVRFEGAWNRDGAIVAAASAEVDAHHLNAEMTDFATSPGTRGKGLACHLLRRLEDRIAAAGILTAYTIARAVSPGMNITFARLGYVYTGRLVNNTPICGKLESMNVWSKPLVSGPACRSDS